jgi:hypothetical protein
MSEVKQLTAKEILAIVEEKVDSVSSFAYGDFDETELGLGEYEEVEQHGGENEGSNWYSVKHFKDHGVYIKTEGYYQSHYGTDFENGFGHEVFPKQKSVTVYSSKKD